jgi:selenium donor protein
MKEIAASAGAACHSGLVQASPVLKAMNVPLKYAMGAVRFSTGIMTSHEEIQEAIQIIGKNYIKLKKLKKPGTIYMHKPDDNNGKPDYGFINTMHAEHETHYNNKFLPSGDILKGFSGNQGCSCKINPLNLEKIISALPENKDKKILVNSSTSDDAAVYRLTKDRAITGTVDFITPIVNDPFTFGKIAAANSLSDIYAMGSKPLFALSIVCSPSGYSDIINLSKILEGASTLTKEAGITISGGHSVHDANLKFGLSVTGSVNPNGIIRNSTAMAGDSLILTKPIGTGIIMSALNNGNAPEEAVITAITSMTTLNKKACEIMLRYKVSACTDISGFGLLGHLKEMCQNSKVDAEILFSEIPLFYGVLKLAEEMPCSLPTRGILDYVSPSVVWDSRLSESEKYILCDPQTSGGLLISVNISIAKDLLDSLKESGIEAACIGRITNHGNGIIFCNYC